MQHKPAKQAEKSSGAIEPIFQPAIVRPKPAINRPGDADENEADAMANQVVRVPAPQSFADQGLNSILSKGHNHGRENENTISDNYISSLESSGQPLTASSRQFFEPRFGHDFSRIRVHADDAAARMAEANRALAYAMGNRIVFNHGQYAPDTTPGKKLLAHELTHVVQQKGISGKIHLQPKPAKAAKPFYQELLDEKAHEEKVLPKGMATGLYFDLLGILPVLNKLINFAQAIDKKDIKAIPALLSDVEKIDVFSVQSHPSDALVFEMISRLMALGLETESTRLRRWFIKKEDYLRGDTDVKRSPNLPDIAAWSGTLDNLKTRKMSDADSAGENFDALTIFFKQAKQELLKIDLKKSAKLAAELVQLLIDSFSTIQQAYQVILDRGMADLAAGKGAKYFLIAKDKLLNKLSGALENSKNLPLEITKTKFQKGNSMHTDAFTDTEPNKRAVKIDFYDAGFDLTGGREISSDFEQIMVTRRRQINVLENIYGLAKDKKGNQTAEAKENAAALTTMGTTGLRLENDDDWRTFVLAKFNENLKINNSPEGALDSVINLLQSYLVAFTIHTPYNIDDAVENPFGKAFPRALSGQFIHDCGIYALRIAYILSLVRMHPSLNLRFRMIALPVHVGLIITGDKLPAYFVQNDEFKKITPAELNDYRKSWVNTDETGAKRSSPVKLDDDKLLAEIAGDQFIGGVDLPYKTYEVPQPAATARKTKDDLWFNLYKGKVTKTELFGKENKDPKDPNYQFQLRYLKILDMIVDHYNGPYLAYRNGIAHKRWMQYKSAIVAAVAKTKSTTNKTELAKATKALSDLVKEYSDPLKAEMDKVDKAFGPILIEQTQLNIDLQKHPDILNKGIDKTSTERIASVMGTNFSWWTSNFYQHLLKLNSGDLKEPLYEELQSPIAR